MRGRREALTVTLAAGVALAAWLPARGQQQAPESLLPPGFGQPAPLPAAPPPGATPAPGAPANPVPAAPVPAGEAVATTDVPITPAEAISVAEPPPELPPEARRSLDLVGSADVYGADAFGDADGRYLTTLMRRLDAPIASRWAEIVLRRALLTPTPAPRNTGAADWVATRAALLLRLGEADGARMLVQGVDVANFSPRLRAAAIQTALATADPAGLCPLPDGREQVGYQPAWPMIRAICATLAGDDATANASIGRGPANDPIDHPLAAKLVNAGAAGRRRVEIDWTAVDALTDWRFGLASALGVVIPQPLLDAAPAWFQAWLARAPMLAATDRVAPARVAAALGPFSNSELVDLYGRIWDEAGEEDADSPAGRLRQAYVGAEDDLRLAALHALWDAAANGAGGERERYATSILTARAAARIAPADDQSDDVAPLIAAMFAAGLDRQAERWAQVALEAGGADGDRAWAMLAVGAERQIVPIDPDRITKLAERGGDGGRHRAAMLAAALGGLGRLSGEAAAQAMAEQGEPVRASPYALALQRAVAGSQRGTVALLVATGMQSPRWGGVPASDFLRMVAAMRAAGMEAEARMIAAEAMARL